MTDLDEQIPDVELGFWAPVGRAVRGGSWAQQAEPTPDRIALATRVGRSADAAALVRHLVVEATEIHELYAAWCIAIPVILRREGVGEKRIAQLHTELLERVGASDADLDAAWDLFGLAAGRAAEAIEAGREAEQLVDDAVSVWRDSHDAHLALTAGWVDAAVHHLGEARLGDLWQELQADGIAHYARYDTSRQAWSLSRALLTQIALEGMHGHLGGPTRQGEIELEEHADRVTMRFRPCGSGGQIVNGGKHGRTTAPHPFAWNEVGVCHYCVHCCVLQQLEPIKRLGYPARVIEPPLTPGQSCSWTVYRDPSLVPDEAYLRVGERPAGRLGRR